MISKLIKQGIVVAKKGNKKIGPMSFGSKPVDCRASAFSVKIYLFPAFTFMSYNPIFYIKDDECDSYGIHTVRINDPPLAKRYGIKTYPSIVYFRNGNPLTYDGKFPNLS